MNMNVNRLIFIRMKYLLLLCCYLFTGVYCVDGYQDRKNQSDLCINGGTRICSKQMQLFNLKDNECEVIHRLPNSPVCGNNYFTGEVDHDRSFSNLIFLTYLYKSDGLHWIPSFNMTFSQIKWKHMRMRFIENGTNGVKHCRDFSMSENIPSNFSFFYDCLWEGPSIQSKLFIFQYQITTYSGEEYLYKYFFRVPDYRNIDDSKSIKDWKVFSAIDVSEREVLYLLVQALPEKFNVTVYIIEVVMNGSVVKKEKIIHDPQVLTFSYKFEVDMDYIPGDYSFNVSFQHPDCGGNCSVSSTPTVVLGRPDKSGSIYALSAFLIVTSFGCVSYLVWMKARRSAHNLVKPPPKMLIIYKPVSVSHFNTMIDVAKYLRKFCNIQVLIDVFGIPESEYRDPNRWYIEAFDSAEYVAVFSHPKSICIKKDGFVSPSIYPKSHETALELLSKVVCSSEYKCKIISIQIPGCSRETLPKEAKLVKSFKFPQDLCKLLKYMGLPPMNDGGKSFNDSVNFSNRDHNSYCIPLIQPKETAPPSIYLSLPASHEDEDDDCCRILDPYSDHQGNYHDYPSGRFTPDSDDDGFAR